jgi:alcohol dehydrogenase (NADP+)
MIPTKAYAVDHARDSLHPWSFNRREVGPTDVLLKIDYCGICHSDIHQVRSEWGPSMYPMVPGHEIVGHVVRAGSAVTTFRAGDLGGIGCFVDSCRECESCREGHQQFCRNRKTAWTYNSVERDGKTPTYGGYSEQIVVDEKYLLHLPENLPLAGVAPLLCAGITTYSPLRKWNIGKGHRVGVLGLGGLGHMAVKFAVSFGAEVTVLSTSPSKREDASRLGAHRFCAIGNRAETKAFSWYFDTIINTVSAPHDHGFVMSLLRRDGVMICVGLPPEPISLNGFVLTGGNKSISGSSLGGIRETQEMLDYCGVHGITSDVEVISVKDVNRAYERVLASDVRYRFVIDLKTL